MAKKHRAKRKTTGRPTVVSRRVEEDQYAATEPDQIRDLERAHPRPETEDEFVTDAEMEIRETDVPSDKDY